jgi:hypothetical protein
MPKYVVPKVCAARNVPPAQLIVNTAKERTAGRYAKDINP